MIRGRVKILTLMLLIALVAVDLALLRWGTSLRDVRFAIWIGLMPAIVVLNDAVVCSLLRTKRADFWLGFAIGGGAVLAYFYIVVEFTPETARRAVNDLILMLQVFLGNSTPSNPIDTGVRILAAFLFFAIVYSGAVAALAVPVGAIMRRAAATLSARHDAIHEPPVA